MSAQTPTVSAFWVYDEAQPGWSVRLDTAAWVAWLEESTTTRFAYPLFDPAKGYIVGRMTVRKERRARRSVLDRLSAHLRLPAQGVPGPVGDPDASPLGGDRPHAARGQ